MSLIIKGLALEKFGCEIAPPACVGPKHACRGSAGAGSPIPRLAVRLRIRGNRPFYKSHVTPAYAGGGASTHPVISY
jgi:hypothetical protein